MGHIHLGRLPKTQPWIAVVDLLHSSAPPGEIAIATAKAAENSLASAVSDPALRHAFWLLTQLPLAARSTDYVDRLSELGMVAERLPPLLTLAAAFQQSIDAHARNMRRKTDLGEMAQLAATEALTSILAADLPGLFGTTGDDVRYELGKLAAPDRFARLSRNFFARLVHRNLEYFLTRAISDHIGPGRSLRSIDDNVAFRAALAQHCFEAAGIIEVFSRDWYSKANWEGGITRAKAAGFTYVAFKKLREELRQRAG